MGVQKGQNNFAAMQKKKISTKGLALTAILNEIPSGMKFSTQTALLKYCADKLGCHHTTILRQSTYMNECRAWWAQQNTDPKMINKRTTDPSELRALLTLCESELAIVRQESARLKKVVARLESTSLPSNSELPGPGSTQFLTIPHGASSDMDGVCHLLKKLLDTKLKDVGISVNGNGEMIDAGFGYTEMIADAKEMRPYLEWLKKLERNQ